MSPPRRVAASRARSTSSSLRIRGPSSSFAFTSPNRGRTGGFGGRAVGGPAHDAALSEAVLEIAPIFKQCTRCVNWVCDTIFWNKKAGLCENCAPDLDEEMASAQAEAAREQIHEKARTVDWTRQRDIRNVAGAVCKSCGAKTQGGKFCPECGEAVNAKKACQECGHEAEGSPKFCPECGQKY